MKRKFLSCFPIVAAMWWGLEFTDIPSPSPPPPPPCAVTRAVTPKDGIRIQDRWEVSLEGGLKRPKISLNGWDSLNKPSRGHYTVHSSYRPSCIFSSLWGSLRGIWMQGEMSSVFASWKKILPMETSNAIVTHERNSRNAKNALLQQSSVLRLFQIST